MIRLLIGICVGLQLGIDAVLIIAAKRHGDALLTIVRNL